MNPKHPAPVNLTTGATFSCPKCKRILAASVKSNPEPITCPYCNYTQTVHYMNITSIPKQE